MKYLAFDIECANHFVCGSMCSMGYVLADEAFNILEREDIIINPRCRVFDKHCKLAYENSRYKTEPHFAQHYHRLKALLEQPDTLIVGHAIINDIRFLEDAFRRYGLPSLRFKYICTQNLYREFAGEINSISVETAATMLGIGDVTAHKAEDDAYVSLRLLQYILEQTGRSVDQLLDEYKLIKGEYRENEHIVQSNARSNKHKLFELALLALKPQFALIGKKERKKRIKFCFDSEFITADIDLARDLLRSLAEEGQVYHSDFSGLNNYIVAEGTQSKRQSKIETVNQNGGKVAIVPHTEFNCTTRGDYSSDGRLIREFSRILLKK